MKKIICITTIIIACLLLFGCSKNNDSKKQIAITGVKDFKWGMTKKDAKEIVIDNKKYKYQTEFRKSIDCSYSNNQFEYEMSLYFTDGLLTDINMSTDCSKSAYQEFLANAKENFKKVDSYNNKVKSRNGEKVKTTTNWFESKTTEYQLEFMESSYKPKGMGYLSIEYSKK